MSNETTFRGEKIQYASLVQGNITRMSTASAIFKGFAATFLAGTVTIGFQDISPIVLGIMTLPLVGFLMLDVYYLQLEKSTDFFIQVYFRALMHVISVWMFLGYLIDNLKSELVDVLSPNRFACSMHLYLQLISHF